MKTKKKLELAKKFLEMLLSERGLEVNDHLPWKIKRTAKELGVSYKDLLKFLAPIFHAVLDAAIKEEPKGQDPHHGGGH